MTIALTSRRTRILMWVVRSNLYCLALIPLGLATAVAAVAGQRRAADRWQARLRGFLPAAPSAAGDTPGLGGALGRAVLSLLLGAVALIPVGMELLWVLRGVLYGFVDRGPYDTSWGGPSRAGAWIAHFLIGTPLTAAGVLALIGLASLHARATVRQPAAWAVVVSLLVPIPAVVFFVAWLHQI